MSVDLNNLSKMTVGNVSLLGAVIFGCCENQIMRVSFLNLSTETVICCYYKNTESQKIKFYGYRFS